MYRCRCYQCRCLSRLQSMDQHHSSYHRFSNQHHIFLWILSSQMRYVSFYTDHRGKCTFTGLNFKLHDNDLFSHTILYTYALQTLPLSNVDNISQCITKTNILNQLNTFWLQLFFYVRMKNCPTNEKATASLRQSFNFFLYFPKIEPLQLALFE